MINTALKTPTANRAPSQHASQALELNAVVVAWPSRKVSNRERMIAKQPPNNAVGAEIARYTVARSIRERMVFKCSVASSGDLMIVTLRSNAEICKNPRQATFCNVYIEQDTDHHPWAQNDLAHRGMTRTGNYLSFRVA